ncbi:hypothetical protein [Arthrobacter oryzae]|uniref:hypothetical protein n=1 Tax=Arthrobacter oryzae TaxID=409290 RepID=UPI002862F66A|nr:hypothetical protein [Arthrobacter oryzae]MDR6506474.1 hypothetical protein [Arthrobacter oryzae]
MTDHKTLILEALAKLNAAKREHAPHAAELAKAQQHKDLVSQAILNGDPAYGMADQITADTRHREAIIAENDHAKKIAELEREIAMKRGQQLAAEIHDGTAGVMTDGGAAAWRKFYTAVKKAATELTVAAGKHDAALDVMIKERLSETDYVHAKKEQVRTADGFITRSIPAGKPWSWIKHEPSSNGIVDMPVIKARISQHPAEWVEVGDLHITEASMERAVRYALFHAQHGKPLESAPEWAK